MVNELKRQLKETEKMIQGTGEIEEGALEVLGCIHYAAVNLQDAKRKEIPLLGWRFVQLIEDLLSDADKVRILMSANPKHFEMRDSMSRSVDMFIDFIKQNDPIILVRWGVDLDIVN